MIKLLFQYKWYLAVILATMIVEPTINSVLNFWLQKMFNSATAGADRIYVIKLLTLGFLLWIGKRLITYVSLVVRDRYICNAKQDVKHKMFVKLFQLNTANIAENSSSGEYISTFTNDITLLEQRFFNQIMGLVSGILSILIMGYSFIALNAKLAFAIMGFGAVTMFVPLFFSRKLNEKNLIYSQKISGFTQRLKEFFVAYPTIKNYAIEHTIAEKFDRVNQDTEDAKFEADCTISLANSVGQLLAWFMQFIGVGLGIVMVVKGEILIGTVIASQAFAGDLALPIQNIVINLNSIRSVKEIVAKLEGLTDGIEAESEADEDGQGLSDRLATRYDIRFDKLALTIGETPIIRDFSFLFESGKKYLIVGLNGSGKSSVFKALKKWFKDCTGRIYVNDTEVSQISNEELSRIVSYLNENVCLFSGTIRDNISLFREYNDESFRRAVNASHVELDLDRSIADEGRNISSGEQRRIEIARTLLRSASVLIFDEVVSTLDIETAYEIEKQVLGYPDKTIIFISHNFSGKLIKEYDEILVMNDGALVSHGTYDRLIQSCDYFRRICEIKFGA